jgi:hypothetical protein
MFILSFTIIVIILLINKKRFKTLIGLALCAFLTGAAFTVINSSGENVLVSSFQSSYKDVTNEEGSWKARMRLIRSNLEIIKKYPFIGNGGLQIRDAKGSGSPELNEAAYGGDLGYIHAVKFLGIPGLIWIITLVIIYYSILLNTLKNPNVDIVMAKFSGCLFTLVLIAAITMNFFQDPPRILILCLAMATLITSVDNEKDEHV